MQNIISANQKSVTESEATKDSIIPFYSASKAMPELGVQFQKVTPYISFSGPIASQQLTFKIPPGSGFMTQASLGFNLTSAANLVAADILNDIGLNMIGQIDWMSNGQPILTQTRASLNALVRNLPIAEQSFIFRYSKPLVVGTECIPATSAVSSFTTYTPLLASFLTTPEKCLLLNQIGDLQLRVTFATALQISNTAVVSLAAAEGAYLYIQTYSPKLSVLNEQIVRDWSRVLIMEMWNSYTETVPLTTTTSTPNYTLTCPFLVFRSHFFIQYSGSDVASNKNFVEIDSITLNVGGVPLVDRFPKSRMLVQKSKSGITSIYNTGNIVGATFAQSSPLVYEPRQVLTVDWTAVESTRSKNMGTIFLQELRGTTISVNYQTSVIADHTLFIVHEYWQNVSFMPGGSGSNGFLSVYSNN